jgi:hypothetical protein
MSAMGVGCHEVWRGAMQRRRAAGRVVEYTVGVRTVFVLSPARSSGERAGVIVRSKTSR